MNRKEAKAAIPDKCRDLAKALLAFLDAHGETEATAQHVDLEIDKLYLWVSRHRLDKAAETHEVYLGMIEAKCAVMLPLSILSLQREGASEETMRANFPRYPESLAEDFAELRQVLREVGGLDPLRVHERSQAQWIDHWRSLYTRGDAKMRADVLAAARAEYPDIDVALITTENP